MMQTAAIQFFLMISGIFLVTLYFATIKTLHFPIEYSRNMIRCTEYIYIYLQIYSSKFRCVVGSLSFGRKLYFFRFSKMRLEKLWSLPNRENHPWLALWDQRRSLVLRMGHFEGSSPMRDDGRENPLLKGEV